jgi:hypothetical protein
MQFLPMAILLAGIPVCISLFWTFDHLVRIEFERFPGNWTADGQPNSLFRPSIKRWSFRTWLATQRCAFTWSIVRPKWSSTDPEARRYARRLQALFGIWILVVIPLFAMSAYIAGPFSR